MFWGTAQRIAWREIKAAPAKFGFVVLAVAVGVGALSGVKGFSSAFRSMLLRNAKQLIAADLQAQVWSLPAPQQLAQLETLARTTASTLTRVTETVSMARAEQQRVPQMVSVKAIDPCVYPFYGKLGLTPARPLPELVTDDQVLVTPELLLRMHTHAGSMLRIGNRQFRIAGVVEAEPDRLASGFGPGMRVLMSRRALDQTGLVQFGSRAAQRYLFRLGPQANLDAMKGQLRRILPRPFFTDYRDGDPSVGRGIDAAERFLSLISLVALIVGALGVAMAMYSHVQQKLDSIAIMKAMGARSDQIIAIYALQTLWLGLSGGLLGVALGAAVERSFPLLIQRFFALLPQVAWDWTFALQGLCLGLLATLLFTLPSLLSVRDVRPVFVFRRDLDNEVEQRLTRWRKQTPAIAAILLALGGLAGLAMWLSQSWKMGAYFFGALGLSLLVLLCVAAAFLFFLRQTLRRTGAWLPPLLRQGLANLHRPGNQARAVLAALGLGVMFTLTTYFLQLAVLRQVNQERPGLAGNVFLLDIRHDQRDDLKRLVERRPGVTGKLQLVGYLVARLTSRNGVPTARLSLATDRKDRLQTSRLSVLDDLPPDAELVAGRWWKPHARELQMAISEDEARLYRFKLGDTLQFFAAGRSLTVPVVAVFRVPGRTAVRTDLLLPRESLKGLPLVYFGAIHVEKEAIPGLETEVFERQPNVTVMNIAELMERVQEGIDQIALAVRFLAGFAIVAGITILSASVAGSRYRRIREVAVLKALGSTKRAIVAIFSVEFTALGVLAGAIGALLANGFSGVIARRFLDTSLRFEWQSCAACMIATAFLANLAGWLASARILDQRPLEVLRSE